MSFRSDVSKYAKKMRVYSYFADGSFDRRDKSRLKPMTRLRKSFDEIRMENEGNIKLKIKDWYDDIDKGHSK